MTVRDAAVQTRMLIPGVVAQRSPFGWGIHHAAWMLDWIIESKSEKNDKLNRWLGYAQGILVQTDTCTLGQVKEINLSS